MTRNTYNLIRGAGTALVLFPAHRRIRISQRLWINSDADALRHDWDALNRDFRAAFTHTVDRANHHGESRASTT